MTPGPAGHWPPPAREALARFLAGRGLAGRGPAGGTPRPAGGELTICPIGDGHSNLTFLVTAGSYRVVVRRPPPPPAPPGAHDVLREARLLEGLRGTPVPVPAMLATAEAGEVVDVPLYVMSYAEGPVVTTSTPGPLDQPRTRRELGEALVDTLAALHAVDWQEAGLGGLGHPGGFNARHLRRMAGLITSDGILPPRFRPVHAWLSEHVPVESAAALVHGDYRIGNVVAAPAAPGRIAAVLDWELATIGDPLLDVGYFLASVPEPPGPRTPVQAMGAAMLEDGYPTRAELAARYARHTGRDLSRLDWYTAMALWKLAVLYEYSRRRAGQGNGDRYYTAPSLVGDFLREAHRAAGLDGPAEENR
jgi:aminoglycoside phosphotransferase (APT) family kinase protein